MSDLENAVRALRKSPSFTIVAVLTIAVGIGANTALFSVYDRLILNPVTIPHPSSLVAIWAVNTQTGLNAPALSWPRFEAIRNSAKAFTSVGISAGDNFALTGNGDPEQLTGLRASADFLPTLGILPARGRNFTAEEDVPNGPAVCILTHEFWQTRFGGRPDIVGARITLDGQPWEVIGVMPPRLSPPFAQVQVIAPRVFEIGGLTPLQVQAGSGYAQAIARLKPGVSLEQANSDLAAIAADYRQRFATRLDANNVSEPLKFVDSLVGNLEPTFYTLLGAVGFVLLIACANVASLFLSRLSARLKEIAVRQSLGATRAQVVRQFLVESLTFSVVAAGLGVLLAAWALSGIENLVRTQLPPDTDLALNPRALAFTGAITIVTAILVGLAPAWQASRADLADVLKDSARGSSGERGGRFRAALIVAEVALSVILLIGSSLLLISFTRLQRTAPGFEAKGTGTAFVSVPASRYPTPARQAQFFDAVVERLMSTTGVTDAAAVAGLPLSGFNPRFPYGVAGRPVLPLPQRPIAGLVIVSDNYFNVMRIPIVAGRAFNAADREGSPGVCIVNESLAKRLFPGESPLGHVMLRGPNAEFRSEIVGVSRDVKTNGLNSPPPDEVYYPMRQLGRPAMSVLARTEGDPSALQATIRAAVTSVDKDQPISLFTTLETTVARSLGVQRIVASLTSVFAALALLLSAIGLYSVLAYAVTQRTSEIGIRVALGATPDQVVALVMRGGLKLTLLGLAIGLLGAGGAARLIQTLLFDVRPLDPVVYGGVALLFSVVAALACLVPSLRASRIDPLTALHAD